MLTLEQGATLVKYARASVEAHLSGLEQDKKEFSFAAEKQGVFVTLLTCPAKELRGCIGFSEPVFSLGAAVAKAAVSAAVSDSRFPKVALGELDKIVIELSVLTVPEKIVLGAGEKYEDKVTVGIDGLIIRRGFYSGLLLPQVPVEFGWDKKEFLMQVCIKAGFQPDEYLDGGTEIYKFQAQIFSEESPSGNVFEKVF
ncbi:MAG: TIGR00296 family protein [archaeon]|nr:TIGR00296 family protein [archaeon]